MKTITDSLMYKIIRRLLKHNKIIFSIHRHLVDKDYQREKQRMYSCAIKSKEIIDYEMNAYQKYWGCPPDDYVRYGLFEKNIDIEEILDYVPMWHYYCVYCSSIFKGINTNEMDDKWYQYQLLKNRGILTPEVIALVIGGKLLKTSDNVTMSLNDLLAITPDNGKIFIKPTRGNSGIGIIVLNKRFDKLTYNGVDINQLSDIPFKKHIKYIVQKELLQREDMHVINPSSLNTFRIQTIYNDGRPEILTIILRVGRKGFDVDNSGQGGLSVDIDIETGKMASHAGRVHGGGQFAIHPDTGYVFEGKKIDNWEAILESIRDICGRIREFKIIGWDMAVSADNKVYVVEFNLGFGIEGTQITRGGLRRRMGIYPQ